MSWRILAYVVQPHTGQEHLKELKQLTTVQLQGTKVTAKGVRNLQAALPECKIEVE